jgi:hypothetical protein
MATNRDIPRRFWLVFGLGLATAILLIYGILSAKLSGSNQLRAHLMALSYILTVAIEVFLPLSLGISAAVRTARYVRLEAYTLLQLTTLSNWQLVMILLRHAHNLWRYVLTFVAGLSPLWIGVAVFPSGEVCYTFADTVCLGLWRQGNAVNNGLAAIPSLIGLVLLCTLAAWAGVWVGAQWRNPLAAASTAFFLLIVPILLAARIYLDDAIVPGWLPDLANPTPILRDMYRDIGIYVVLPMILLVIVSFLAMRSVRKPG